MEKPPERIDVNLSIMHELEPPEVVKCDASTAVTKIENHDVATEVSMVQRLDAQTETVAEQPAPAPPLSITKAIAAMDII